MSPRKAVISLTFNREWIKTRMEEGQRPVETFLQAFHRGDAEAQIKRQDDNSCTIHTAYEPGRIVELENSLRSVLREQLGREPDRSIVKWTIAPVWEKKEEPAPAPPQQGAPASAPESRVEKAPPHEGEDRRPEVPAETPPQGEERRETVAASQGKAVPDSAPTQAARPAAEQSAVDGILSRIDALVGAEGFKELAHELAQVAPQILRHNTQDAFARRAYLFAIGDGCGLTTQLDLLAELLGELRLFPFSSGSRVTEIPGDRKLGEMRNLVEGRCVVRQIVCIDLCQWMDKVRTPEFQHFLQFLQEENGRHIFAFRIPFVDQETRAKVQAGLGDILTIRMVSTAPYTLGQFRAFAQRLLRERGFSIQEEGWQRFEQRIIAEKSDGHFYGLSTVMKVLDEVLYEKHLSVARSLEAGEETVIRAADIPSAAQPDRRPAMEQLDELIGIDSIRARIMEILAQIEVGRSCGEALQPALHMRFVGNPGTGKTTVARILGQLMRERNILSKGQFFEYSGRDFCGQYIGETAPKTAAMCRDAYGSVLFIDEAYSLFRGDKTDRDYGREAIDTLIAQMENHRQDFVVIMAGYPDDMEVLMEGNGGLASRMPYVIEFPNYGREDLFQIYMSMVKKSFQFEPQLEQAVRDYFDSLSDEVIGSKEFANARFVRNLFERTWAKASTRRQMEPDKPLILCAGDFERAAADREFQALQERKKGHVGF